MTDDSGDSGDAVRQRGNGSTAGPRDALGERPLAGVRVVTTAEIYPGPYVTMLLADMGADVIIVERPGGEPGRSFPPMFDALNRGKRSLAVDLTDPRGLDCVHRVLDSADVAVFGSRPAALARFGFDAATLLDRLPRLIYAAITAFGRANALRDRPAHDLSVQALAGVLEPDVRGRPLVPRLPAGDLAAAVFLTSGILARLYRRSITGRGGPVEVSMLDALISWQAVDLTPLANGEAPAPMPPQDPGYGCFATADGRVIALSISFKDAFWQRLCAALDLPAVAGVPAADRVARRAELQELLAAVIGAEPAAHWERVLTAADVPFGAVAAPAEVAASLGDLRSASVRTGPGVDARTYIGSPVDFGADAGPVATSPPAVGAQSREVLAECGIGAAVIDELVDAGVVVEHALSVTEQSQNQDS